MPLSRACGVGLLAMGIVLLSPKEGRVSGAAHGTVTRADFELSATWGPRIHFRDPGSERAHHDAERKEIAAALEPLADRIQALLDGLKTKPPWSDRLEPYQATDPGVSLATFEQADHRDMLADIQARGPYLYQTSFPHQLPGRGQASVRVRLVLSGKPALADLHALEDGLHALRTPMPTDANNAANPDGVIFHLRSCEKYSQKLERVRTGLAKRLEDKQLLYRGHSMDGALFTASLQGPELCLVNLELTMAGRHRWGRTGQALVEAVAAVFPGAREWPGFPHSKEADEAPWQIQIPAPPD